MVATVSYSHTDNSGGGIELELFPCLPRSAIVDYLKMRLFDNIRLQFIRRKLGNIL